MDKKYLKEAQELENKHYERIRNNYIKELKRTLEFLEVSLNFIKNKSVTKVINK
jgi:hypothetical protein